MDKTSMIAMAYEDFLQDASPYKHEAFAAVRELIQLGKMVAYYDDRDGLVKYQQIQEVA